MDAPKAKWTELSLLQANSDRLTPDTLKYLEQQEKAEQDQETKSTTSEPEESTNFSVAMGEEGRQIRLQMPHVTSEEANARADRTREFRKTQNALRNGRIP